MGVVKQPKNKHRMEGTKTGKQKEANEASNKTNKDNEQTNIHLKLSIPNINTNNLDFSVSTISPR